MVSRSEKVLVALDGSPVAAAALPLARTVARRLNASVEVIHVARPEQAEGGARAIQPTLQPEERLDVRVSTTDPALAILDAATEPTVALLVLTTHGATAEHNQHLGRVAQVILARTRRPVLLIPPETATPEGETPFDRLLIPFDGSPATATALVPAVELAGKLRANVDLLYVASEEPETHEEPGHIGAPRYVDQPHHEWPEWASEVMARVNACLAGLPQGLRAQVYLAHGNVAAEVVRHAAERQEHGIVLVRRSLEPGRARALREILLQAACPILVVTGAARP